MASTFIYLKHFLSALRCICNSMGSYPLKQIEIHPTSTMNKADTYKQPTKINTSNSAIVHQKSEQICTQALLFLIHTIECSTLSCGTFCGFAYLLCVHMHVLVHLASLHPADVCQHSLAVTLSLSYKRVCMHSQTHPQTPSHSHMHIPLLTFFSLSPSGA